ncbi:MAG: choice-of-anchor C family protein, partial [Rhodospirillaceae bacterium]|nr:choice-of-anchor C family protein [Rhodospirillaceae bacterium]
VTGGSWYGYGWWLADNLTFNEEGAVEDETYVFSVDELLANDTDVDATDTLEVTGLDADGVLSTTSANGGTVTLDTVSGEITYDPAAGFNGEDTFDYTISDGNGGFDTATVTLNVAAVNDAPEISYVETPANLFDGSFEPGLGNWTVTGNGVDRVGTSTWDASDGTYSLDLNAFQPGGIQQTIATDVGVTYTVLFDMAGNPGQQTVKDMSVSAGGTTQNFSFDNAADGGTSETDMNWTEQSFTFVATSTSTVLSFDSLVPSGAWGPTLDNVRLTRDGLVLDEDGALDITGLSVADVDAAEGSGAVQATLSVDHGVITLAQLTGLTIDAGADGTSSVTVTGQLGDVNAAIASIAYDPDAEYNGADAVTLTVDDLGNTGSGGAQTDSQAIDITVNSVNDAPVVDASKFILVPAYVSPVYGTEINLGLSTPTDVDNDPLSITVLLSDEAVTLNGVLLNAGDTLTASDIPNLMLDIQNSSGAGRFDYEVSDGTESVVGTVRLNVYANNTNFGIAQDGDDVMAIESNDGKTLDGKGGDDLLIADSSDNATLIGGIGDDEIHTLNSDNVSVQGGGGEDSIFVSGGSGLLIDGGDDDDLFDFANTGGSDSSITGFEAGAGTDDRIDVSDFGFTDLADLLTATNDVGADTVITLDGNDSLTLIGVQMAELHEDDFIL